MSPFSILGLEPRFDLDLTVAERNHRELSRALHPDKYTQAGASERLNALSKAVEVNEAWRIIRDPIRRAEALFSIHGVPVGEDKEPKADPEFLMEMLEEREALSDARDASNVVAVTRVIDSVRVRQKETEQRLAKAFANPTTISNYVSALGELRFYRRLLEEAETIKNDVADSVVHV